MHKKSQKEFNSLAFSPALPYFRITKNSNKMRKVQRIISIWAAALSLCSCNLFIPAHGTEGTTEETPMEQIMSEALEIPEAREAIGSKDVWVHGFIIGGDLSAKNINLFPPFSSDSNLAIGMCADSEFREECMSVSLPQGRIRSALNLAANPDNIGLEVFLRGEIVESYFGMPGIKNLTDFRTENSL